MFRLPVLGRALRLVGGAPGLGIFVASAAGVAGYAAQLSLKYPIGGWLVWRLLPLWLWTLVFNLALVVAGGAVLRGLLPKARLGLAERLVHSLALGLALFALVFFGVGALGGLGTWFAVALPVAFALLGAREALLLGREVRAALLRPRGATALERALGLGAVGFVVWMLGLVYLEALTPNSFNFDAVWYHVPVAQDYARLGKIVPFFGDNHRAYPHLASLLHTFALLVPGLSPTPLRWMLMLHLEFAMVVWKLVGVVAIAQYLLRGRRPIGVGAVFFLFPSVFIYDQNIGGSADHVLGASAAPIFLALARTLPAFHLRWALVTGVAAGVHVLTKYQAVYLVFAVAVTVFVRFAYFGLRALWARLRGRLGPGVTLAKLFAAPALILGGALLVSSPHFIKNAIFYQNPVYPFLSSRFPSSFDDWDPKAHKTRGMDGASKSVAASPRSSDADEPEPSPSRPKGKSKGKGKPKATAAAAAARYDFRFKSRAYDFDPQGDSWVEKLVWANKTFFDWSFLTGNRHLTEQRPYMGALFTLLLPVLLFLRGAGRVWLGVAVTYLAFFIWALTNANDRYLLAFLTLPIGVTAALLVRAAEHGVLARLGLTALVGLQLVWGFDAPFFYGGQRLNDAISLIKSGYDAPSDDARFRYRRAERQIAESFPEDAVVLGRYYKALLGVDRMMLNTHPDIQTYVDFKKLKSVRQFWQLCRDRGITHLLRPDGERQPTRAQETILFDALLEVSPGKRRLHGTVIAEIGSEPPPDDGPLLVYVRGVREYDDGVYAVQQLSLDNRKGSPDKSVQPLFDAEDGSPEELIERAGALYIQRRALPANEAEAVRANFEKVESFGNLEVWLRR